jgi:hypothetical protein
MLVILDDGLQLGHPQCVSGAVAPVRRMGAFARVQLRAELFKPFAPPWGQLRVIDFPLDRLQHVGARRHSIHIVPEVHPNPGISRHLDVFRLHGRRAISPARN